MKLQSKNCVIHANKLGFIEHSAINEELCDVPAYPVLFRDYTRTNPLCRQWDMTAGIKNIFVEHDWIKYTKQVESIQLICRIEVQEDGWDWHITIHGKCPLNHRFGVAIPWIVGETVSFDKKIMTPVSQYSTSLQQAYNDQSILLLPMLTRHNRTYHSIFGSPNQDCHFFTYDDTAPYCRITASTTRTKTFAISYRSHVNSSSAMYVSAYPKAENIIYVWKPLFKQIASKQGVEITYQHKNDIIERSEARIRISEPTTTQLDRFSQHLKAALDKYPNTFLARIGVSMILLSGKIIRKDYNSSRYYGTQAAGMMFGRGESSKRWIFLDVSQNNTAVLHHEIFHYLSEHINLDTLPDVVEESKNEFYADMFADLMLKPSKTDARSEALRKEVLRYCSDIKFAEPSVNSNAQIWAILNNTTQSTIFGDMPSDAASDFVSDIMWQQKWHENRSAC